MDQIMLYGACEFAQWTHKRILEKTTGKKTLGFIDNNPDKQGKNFRGLPVMSFEEAIQKYDEQFDIYITANEKTIPNIIGFLLENNIVSERILNYEPVQKRLGCAFCETQIIFQYVSDMISIKLCGCITQLGSKRLRPEYNIKPRDFNQGSFNHAIALMNEFTAKIADGVVPTCCEGCPFIKEQYYFLERKKRHVIFGGAAPCNYKCKNCTNVILFEQYTGRSSLYDDIINTVDILEKSEELHQSVTIAFGVGEPTLYKEHGIFLERMQKYPIMFLTNGYIYSQSATGLLDRGNSEVYVSLDAGTAESYQKIKGVDGFETVKNNLREYTRHGTVILKYIIFEGINDNEVDFANFIQFADEVADMVLISRDFYAEGELSDETLLLAAKFIKHYRDKMMLSDIIGFKRGSEPQRLQKFLEELS